MPSRKIALSIVSISYKDPAGLRFTFESLLPLKDSDLSWEHVVVDSSPELNRALIQDYESRGWPLVHVNAPPEGIYSAQNTGIQKASGHFIWILNGGDGLEDFGALKALIERMEGDERCDLGIGAAWRCRAGEALYRVFPPDSMRAAIWGGNKVCHQAVLYRREVFVKIGLFDSGYSLAADYDHHVRCYMSGLKITACSDQALVKFDSSGVSASQWVKVWREFMSISRKYAEQMPIQRRLPYLLSMHLGLAKIRIIKFVGDSGCGKHLRPVWIWLQTRR